MERCALFWLQRSFKIQFGTRNFPRRWATLDARTAGNVIETLIAQHDSVSLNFVIKAAAAPLPASPPHFKNVSEIGADIDAHRNYQGSKSVVHDTREVVSRRVPGSYVVLLGDANFIQLRTPSESSTGAGLPLSTR